MHFIDTFWHIEFWFSILPLSVVTFKITKKLVLSVFHSLYNGPIEFMSFTSWQKKGTISAIFKFLRRICSFLVTCYLQLVLFVIFTFPDNQKSESQPIRFPCIYSLHARWINNGRFTGLNQPEAHRQSKGAAADRMEEFFAHIHTTFRNPIICCSIAGQPYCSGSCAFNQQNAL